jgi:glutamate-1-semialdehyde 2,1-aminomutase
VTTEIDVTPDRRQRSADTELRRRANAVVPNGMYGHQNMNALPAIPQYIARSRGARLWDVDGNEYVDLMCSWGPVILGHGDPVVEEAAERQRRQGDCLNGPAPIMVELAEAMVATVADADWAMFAKNGTDATGLALTTARAATGRSKVLMARNSYHGIDAWALPNEAPGTTAEEHLNTVWFDYNDLDSVEAAVAQAGEGTIAAIVCTPHRHDVYTDQVPAERAFAQGVREICDRVGAALILDDVRCGLRIDLRGSWEQHGVRPDLSAWSKSLANGYALAVLLGAEPYREAAGKIVATGSFWLAGAPMAAALKTIEILKATDGIKAMENQGTRLKDGLRTQAEAHGFEVSVSGPPAMPLLLFADDAPDFAKGLAWSGHCAGHGVYLHPVHNWFLSTAHDEAIIDAALERTDLAFADLKRSL